MLNAKTIHDPVVFLIDLRTRFNQLALNSSGSCCMRRTPACFDHNNVAGVHVHVNAKSAAKHRSNNNRKAPSACIYLSQSGASLPAKHVHNNGSNSRGVIHYSSSVLSQTRPSSKFLLQVHAIIAQVLKMEESDMRLQRAAQWRLGSMF